MKILKHSPILALLLMAGCGSSPDGSPNALEKAFDKGFNEKWRSSFVASCAMAATPKAGAAMANKMCGCIGDQLQGLPIKERMNLPPEKTQAAIRYCQSRP